MAAPSTAPQDTAALIVNLNNARRVCLADPTAYSKIVPGVLPIIVPHAAPELRQWGSDFLAEVFASPVVATEDKQVLALQAIHLLKDYLDYPEQDFAVVRSTIQALCNVYPLVFRHTTLSTNSDDWKYWPVLMEAKSRILRQMDSAALGLRIVCIKFVQQVVLTQTPGIITDPRRTERNEISLALVPQGHQLLSASKLEAEASGLLDRILGTLQENKEDALLVTATLNCLGSLCKSRATISNKIVNAILAFNPFKLSDRPLTPLIRVQMRSMERTTRSLLSNILKRQENLTQPHAQRIQSYLERMTQMRLSVYDESASRKRQLASQDVPVQVKRQRVDVEVPLAAAVAPQGPPQPTTTGQGTAVSYKQIYSLTDDPRANIDVTMIPRDLITKIVAPILQHVDAAQLQAALDIVRQRYAVLGSQQAAPVPAAKSSSIQSGTASPEDEDDDYEPDFLPSESADQVKNRVEMDTAEDLAVQPVPLGPFKLPAPPPLSQAAIKLLHDRAVHQFYADVGNAAAQANKSGATASRKQLATMTLIQRLGTRLSVGMGEHARGGGETNSAMAEGFRQRILEFILGDWRKRIDVAISWLTEEWETDREIDNRNHQHELLKQKKQGTHSSNQMNGSASSTSNLPHKHTPSTPTYDSLVVKLLNELFAFIGNENSETKILIRFLSEIPALNQAMIDKVKALALDPERIPLVIMSFRYLLMFRPALREMVLDAMEDMWRNYEGAARLAQKDLLKYRPSVVQDQKTEDVAVDNVAPQAVSAVAPEAKVET